MFENVNRAAREEVRSTFHNGESSTQGLSGYVPNSNPPYLTSTSREQDQVRENTGSFLRLSDAGKESILNQYANADYLLRIRRSVYQKLNMRIYGEQDQAVIPYGGHLNSQQLDYVVSRLSDKGRYPSLWEMDGKRFLLKKENRNAQFMDTAFGFRSEEHHKLYMSVWQELGVGTDTWRLLGLVKLPARRKFGELRDEVLHNSPYPILDWKIVDGSTFQRTG